MMILALTVCVLVSSATSVDPWMRCHHALLPLGGRRFCLTATMLSGVLNAWPARISWPPGAKKSLNVVVAALSSEMRYHLDCVIDPGSAVIFSGCNDVVIARFLDMGTFATYSSTNLAKAGSTLAPAL